MNAKSTADSFRYALWKLEEEGRERSAQKVDRLSLKDIKTAPLVFQPRDIDSSFLASDKHVKTLTEAIVDAAHHVLEPLTVWWSGKGWYVIDGHHRLQAYKLAKEKVKLPAIPVSVFEGTLQLAVKESAALNCRDKLPMSKAEKLDRAWKLVCLSEVWTRADIHRATGASIRTIATMRLRKAELGPRNLNLLDKTWEEVRRGDHVDKDEGWAEQQAIDWQKKFVKAFGTKLADQPEIAARALELYSPRLIKDLMDWWSNAEELEEDEIDEAEPELIQF